MKLYYAPKTCSLAPIILAEWLSLPLEIQQVNHRDPSDEFLAINPLGAVPALDLDNGRHMTQVDAILQYFCALKPGSGLDGGEDLLDRFELHRWVAVLTGDFQPPFGMWFNPARFTTDHSDEGLKAVKDAVAKRIGKVASILDQQVGDTEHVALGRRTLLDGYAYAMVRWINLLDDGMKPYPNLSRMMNTLAADPGVKRALERESGKD